MTAALECEALTVAFSAAVVLDRVDLVVAPGEVVAVLGPSGSGKTTLLSTVAGFVAPRAGRVLLAGRLASSPRRSLPPESRDVAMVFQHYALWPHLSAVDTVAYPLRRRGQAAPEARRQALQLLDRMGVAELAGRRPAEMSGGQQQRVGLARALARSPSLYLFDEPTAHLDTALRGVLQDEMTDRRRADGSTALYATHDAAEALAVADRVALLRGGRLAQVGAPAEVYEQPADLWAAHLTGPASVLAVQAEGVTGGRVALTVSGERLRVVGGRAPGGGEDVVLVRPEWAALGGNLPAEVEQVRYRGPHTDYRLATPAGSVDVRHPGMPAARAGDRVGWTLHRVWVARRATGSPGG